MTFILYYAGFSNIFYHPKVKLVEVTECSLMSHHYNTCCKQKMNLSSDQSHMSKESARRILFRDFGGKKAMKVLDRKEKMKINVDAVKDQLDKTLLGWLKDKNTIYAHIILYECLNIVINITFLKLDIGQSGSKQKDEFDREKEEQDHILKELVPKMNKEATKLIDVYNFKDLIDDDVWESLNEEALDVLRTNFQDLP